MTTSKNREQLIDEIFSYSEYSRCTSTPSQDNEIPKTTCDCVDHPNELSETLREGAYVTCILQRRQTPEMYDVSHPVWVIQAVTCSDCPIAAAYERIEKDTSTAIVEGVLEPGEDCLVLSPRFVWDMHQPETNAELSSP